ncbi:MAG: hypothetical protein PVF05_00305 [Gemmatimonadales bacterium]
MPTSSGRAGLAAALALIVGTAIAAPSAAPARSADRIHRPSCREPFGGMRMPDVTYLLATPRGDTVPDTRGDGDAFGQLADVARVGGDEAEAVSAAARDGGVILVPWGFDDDCRPIEWSGPWRWATVGHEGFFRARLRPRSEWIDGRPTLDVLAAVWEGFPASPWEHPMAAGRPLLGADEVFELYDRLPTEAAIAARPYGAVSDLVEWRRAAGDRAEAYPAGTLIRAAFRMAELARVRSTPLPFEGTYRMRVERDADTLATFLLRTGYVGTEPLDDQEAAAGPLPAAPRPSDTYAAAVALADRPEDLPAADPGAPPPSGCVRALGLRVAAVEFTPGDAPRGWRAELETSFVAACFPGIEVLAGLRPPEPDALAADGSTDATPTVFTGAFRHEADGRFTFRQPAALADGSSVVLLGERISLDALPVPPTIPEAAP